MSVRVDKMQAPYSGFSYNSSRVLLWNQLLDFRLVGGNIFACSGFQNWHALQQLFSDFIKLKRKGFALKGAKNLCSAVQCHGIFSCFQTKPAALSGDSVCDSNVHPPDAFIFT